MFGFYYKKLKYLLRRGALLAENSAAAARQEQAKDGARLSADKLADTLADNIAYFKQTLGNSGDLVIHEFWYDDKRYHAALFFIDGLVNTDIITQSVLRPLLENSSAMAARGIHAQPAQVKELVLCSGDVTEDESVSKLMDGLLSGNTVLVFEHYEKGLLISTKGWEKRAVSEPETESVVRGPREGFVENLRTNTALMRRKIKSPLLRMEQLVVGEKTKTDVCLCYLDTVVKPEVVALVRERISAIKTDAILDSGYIEEFIEDRPFSIFPTISYTEKPDVAAAKVLEGRVAIIADGSPFVLTAPMLFTESFQTSEDYSVRYFYASFNRLLRFFAYFITVFGPAMYLALTTFHQELIPSTLLFTITKAREGTPFPAFLEALVLVISFEILREAGIRLPHPVGQAISIVGALVMGDAAVSAGLVGAPMVITIAITAVSGFAIPAHADSILILRLAAMVCATLLGGFGITVAALAMMIHLGSIKSFGVDYFDGLTVSRNQEDKLVRMPQWFIKKRPLGLAGQDVVRTVAVVPPPEKKGQ
ncbi:MAG: spore germination protein [Oscillospiraceae bacterium]